MRPRWARRWALVIVLVLTGNVAAAPWTQMQGDGGKSGVTDLATGPLDVVRVFRAFPATEHTYRLPSAQWVETPHGLTGVTRAFEDDACTLVHIEWRSERTTRLPLSECRGAWIQGYDPVADTVLICTGYAYDEAALQARDAATGDLVWQVRPSDLGVLPSIDSWHCTQSALDIERRFAVTPFLATRTGADLTRHRIAKVSLTDGSVLWDRIIPTYATAKAGLPDLRLPATDDPIDLTGPDFAPLSVTLTATGSVVIGALVCPDVHQCTDLATAAEAFTPISFAFAWIDDAGNVRGMQRATLEPNELEDETGARQATTGSLWSAAQGNIAAQIVGDRLVTLDPQSDNVVRSVPVDGAEGVIQGILTVQGPTWQDDLLFLPFARAITTVDAVDLNVLWTWPGRGPEWLYPRVVAQPDGSAWVLVVRAITDIRDLVAGQQAVDAAALLRFDAATGAIVQEIMLPLPDISWSEPEIQLPSGDYTVAWIPGYLPLPLSDRSMVVINGAGTAVLLAPIDPMRSPPATVSTLHPGLGETITVQLARELVPEAVAVHVDWGDRTSDDVSWPREGGDIELEHRYNEQGRLEALVTARAEDGTTRTRVLPIDVGGIPRSGPPERMPQLTVTDAYPAVGDSVQVVVPRPDGEPVEVFASWGDGTVAAARWQSDTVTLVHQYEAPGARDATFTAVFLDGTTASRVVRLDVGGDPPLPPADLNWFQRRFAPENQDTTWGIMGLALVMVGGGWGLLARHRRGRGVQRDLETLDRIQAKAAEDPLAALRELHAYRQRMRRGLAKGRLTGADYRVLSARISNIIKRLHGLLLGPISDRLSPSFNRMLEAALEDGILTAREADRIREGLQHERELLDSERSTIEGLLDEWAVT